MVEEKQRRIERRRQNEEGNMLSKIADYYVDIKIMPS